MTLRDFTKTNRRITLPKENTSIFGLLIEETCKRIAALEIFHNVGPMIREQQIIKCPACIILPQGIEESEHAVSGARFWLDHIVNIGFALKGPNDCILVQQMLYYEQAVRRVFAKGTSQTILVYPSVIGHFNTQVRSSTIEPISLTTSDVLAFSSGLNIVYSVWTSL